MEYEVDNLLNELSQIDGILRVAVINNINKKLNVVLIWMANVIL